MRISEKKFKDLGLREVGGGTVATAALNVSMNQRRRDSLGAFYMNAGVASDFSSFEKVSIDYSRRFYLFDVVPMGAPRMTQADKWRVNPNHPDPLKRQREVVSRYFAMKSLLLAQAAEMNFVLLNVLEAIYFVPMPDSWSEKKKSSLLGLPCLAKPDTDNITKGIKDCLRLSDSDIWWDNCRKYWTYAGSILIYQ